MGTTTNNQLLSGAILRSQRKSQLDFKTSNQFPQVYSNRCNSTQLMQPHSVPLSYRLSMCRLFNSMHNKRSSFINDYDTSKYSSVSGATAFYKKNVTDYRKLIGVK